MAFDELLSWEERVHRLVEMGVPYSAAEKMVKPGSMFETEEKIKREPSIEKSSDLKRKENMDPNYKYIQLRTAADEEVSERKRLLGLYGMINSQPILSIINDITLRPKSIHELMEEMGLAKRVVAKDGQISIPEAGLAGRVGNTISIERIGTQVMSDGSSSNVYMVYGLDIIKPGYLWPKSSKQIPGRQT